MPCRWSFSVIDMDLKDKKRFANQAWAESSRASSQATRLDFAPSSSSPRAFFSEGPRCKQIEVILNSASASCESDFQLQVPCLTLRHDVYLSQLNNKNHGNWR